MAIHTEGGTGVGLGAAETMMVMASRRPARRYAAARARL